MVKRMALGFVSTVMALASLAQGSTIAGLVMDSVANKPLASASVMIKAADGSNIAAGITDRNGNFSLKVADSRVISSATFSYVQFAEKIVLLAASQNQSTIHLGTILMHYDANALEQVIVQGKKPPVAMRFDRQVFKADTYANATGGSGIDILRNLPAISVDAAGQIALRGSSSFLLLINGKVVQGDAATILAQIPAGNIESIEIITNPSAAYDADGRSGIVNVVTKNFTAEGWILQANVMGGLPTLDDFDNDRRSSRYSGDISAGYRKNKFDFNASVNYLRNDQNGFREGDVYTIIGNMRTDFPSNGERSFKKYNYGIRLAMGYAINDRNQLTAGFYQGKRFQIRDANLLYNNRHTNLTTGAISRFDYYNANRQQKEGDFTLANLEWAHAFANKSKLTVTGLYERAALEGLTTNLNTPAKGSSDTLQYTRNPSNNPLDAWRIKLDYKTGQWSAGYQFRYDVQDGNFLYLTQIPGTNDFEIDPAFTSDVKAENFIHAGYLQYDGKKDALQYSAGLRVETTDRELQFSKGSEKRDLSLVNFFPNALVKYNFDNRWSVKAGLSRRIRRTNNFELNPFPEREHSETLEQGDPDLLPELIYNVEAGLEHTYSKGNFFATPYFQSILNPIQRVNKVYNDTILNRVFTNGKRATQIGLELGSTHAITKWWQSVAGFNIYYYSIEGSLFANTIQASNSAWAYTLNLTESFSLGKNWSSQLAINFLSERPTLQGEDSYFLNPSLSVKKQTEDKRWSFQLLCQYLDLGWNRSNQQRITTRGSDFFTTTNYLYEVNQIQFSVGFNLLKQNRKVAVPNSEIGEKEF